MFGGNLFLILVIPFVVIQGQEYEGLEETWVCTSNYDYDAINYGVENKECFYAATPVPHPFEDPLFPELSCHPGFNLVEMRRMFRRAWLSFTCGPNLPLGGETYQHGCLRFNAMYMPEEDSYVLDLMDFERIGIDDEKCDKDFEDCNRKYWFKDSSKRLNDMFGEELGGTLMQKIKADCQPVLHRVFFEDKKRCADPEAEEFFDCVNKAIGC